MTDAQMTEFLDGVVGAVEANSFETLSLWRECHQELKMPWVDRGSGLMEIVGTVGDRPVCISLLTSVVDGQKILFYDPTSQVVDHAMIDEWLVKNLPRTAFYGERPNRTDAMNFHNVLHTARRSALSQNEGDRK